MIYEAKILKLDNWDENTGTVGPHFFVHYKGWKQTRVSVTLPSNDAQFLTPVLLQVGRMGPCCSAAEV